MIIRLPWIESIDTLNLPNDFEDRVKKSFGKFTEGTRKNCTYQDKLQYLDHLRCYYIRGQQGGRAEVKKMIGEKVCDYLDNCGEMPDISEILSLDFLEECYGKGFLPLIDKYERGSSSDNDKTLKVIAEIIKIVMNWEYENVRG